MAKPKSSNAISWALFSDLKSLYNHGIRALAEMSPYQRPGINGFHCHALSIYPLAVASWEAFLNKKCLGIGTQFDYPTCMLWPIINEVERWEIELKTFQVPNFLFGQTFDKSTQPYQDFTKLVKIRNSLVHYHQYDAPLKILQDLE